jgi:methionyl-tRNA formyltransferase
MKILLFGCQKIAVDVIKVILDSEYDLVGVITCDEERDRLFGDELVSEFCFANNISSFRPDDNKPLITYYDMIASLKPDIMFSIYYRRILPKDIIDLPRLGCINLHPGLLPLDRAANPTYWNVRRGDKEAGTTLHYIEEGMDTGDIIAQDKMKIENRTGFELNNDIMDLGVKLFKNNFNAIMNETNIRVPQDNSQATCNIKFNNNMRYIDWCQSAENIINHIRAHARPYIGSLAYTKSGVKIAIHKAELLKDIRRNDKGPGSFVSTSSGSLIVQTHTTPILLTDFVYVGDKFFSYKLTNNGNCAITKGRFLSGVPE